MEETESRLASTLKFSLAVLGLAALFFVATSRPALDISPLLTPLQAISPHPLIEPHSNMLVSWRMDPAMMLLASLLTNDSVSPGAPVPWLLLLFTWAGVFALLRSLGASERYGSTITALFSGTLAILPFLINGHSRVLSGVLLWYPWLIFSARQYLLSPGLRPLLVAACFSICFALSANQLAAPLMILALYSASSLSESHPSGRQTGLLWLLCIIPALYALFSMPAPFLPAYPPLSHVVTDDGLPGLIRPLTGADSPVQIIDRSRLFAELWGPVYLLLIGTGIFSLHFYFRPILGSEHIHTSGSKDDSGKSTQLLLALSLTTIAALDIFLPEAFAQIAPLASISRMVPGLFFFRLAPVALLLAAFHLLLWLFTAFKDWHGVFTALFTSACLANTGSFTPVADTSCLHKHLSSPALERVMLSPSLGLLRREGFWLVSAPEVFDQLKAVPAKSFRTEFKTSLQSADFNPKFLTDGKDNTRWATRQTGTEWLELTFDRARKIRGIRLSTGDYATDFPRGIRVLPIEDCHDEKPVTGPALYSSSEWQGAVKFTEDGYPYYSSQSDVSIVFKQQITACGLRIEQTGASPFDWSVAEVYYLLDE